MFGGRVGGFAGVCVDGLEARDDAALSTWNGFGLGGGFHLGVLVIIHCERCVVWYRKMY